MLLLIYRLDVSSLHSILYSLSVHVYRVCVHVCIVYTVRGLIVGVLGLWLSCRGVLTDEYCLYIFVDLVFVFSVVTLGLG